MVEKDRAARSPEAGPTLSRSTFLLVVLLVIAGAVLRSAIATRLDDFTLDEGYHIVAGISYVQRGDFRINPEHPPLVKLWVGGIVSALGFHLDPFRVFNGKDGERSFVNDVIYVHNDPEILQHRARVAMWAFNGLLLVLFACAVRRVFGAVVAIGTLLFLVIDPTVAAHMPVVMTDLPVSLLSATALLFAARAFRQWGRGDLAACSLALGLALATKHSAPVFCVIIAAAGLWLAFVVPRTERSDTRPRRLAKLCAVLIGAVVILWGSYFFRFTESPTSAETFNRPLAAKIADLRSPAKRAALAGLSLGHLLPRAYLWGLADTLRAGVEGRVESRLAFGKPRSEAPSYFFPGVVAVKLPIGLVVLIFTGTILLLVRRLPASSELPAGLLLGSAVGYFVVLANGASYGGIRHALPAVLLLSVFGGLAVHSALVSRGRWLKATVGLAFLAAGASALPGTASVGVLQRARGRQ